MTITVENGSKLSREATRSGLLNATNGIRTYPNFKKLSGEKAPPDITKPFGPQFKFVPPGLKFVRLMIKKIL